MITKNTHRKRSVVAIIHRVKRSPERERERERKNKKEKQRDTFREREPSSLVGSIVVLSFDFERAREDVSLSLSLLAHMAKRRVSSDLAIRTTTRGRNHQR